MPVDVPALRRQIALDVIDDMIRRTNFQPHAEGCPLSAIHVKDHSATCTCWRGHQLDLLQAVRQEYERGIVQ